MTTLNTDALAENAHHTTDPATIAQHFKTRTKAAQIAQKKWGKPQQFRAVLEDTNDFFGPLSDIVQAAWGVELPSGGVRLAFRDMAGTVFERIWNPPSEPKEPISTQEWTQTAVVALSMLLLGAYCSKLGAQLLHAPSHMLGVLGLLSSVLNILLTLARAVNQVPLIHDAWQAASRRKRIHHIQQTQHASATHLSLPALATLNLDAITPAQEQSSDTKTALENAFTDWFNNYTGNFSKAEAYFCIERAPTDKSPATAGKTIISPPVSGSDTTTPVTSDSDSSDTEVADPTPPFKGAEQAHPATVYDFYFVKFDLGTDNQPVAQYQKIDTLGAEDQQYLQQLCCNKAAHTPEATKAFLEYMHATSPKQAPPSDDWIQEVCWMLFFLLVTGVSVAWLALSLTGSPVPLVLGALTWQLNTIPLFVDKIFQIKKAIHQGDVTRLWHMVSGKEEKDWHLLGEALAETAKLCGAVLLSGLCLLFPQVTVPAICITALVFVTCISLPAIFHAIQPFFHSPPKEGTAEGPTQHGILQRS